MFSVLVGTRLGYGLQDHMGFLSSEVSVKPISKFLHTLCQSIVVPRAWFFDRVLAYLQARVCVTNVWLEMRLVAVTSLSVFAFDASASYSWARDGHM